MLEQSKKLSSLLPPPLRDGPESGRTISTKTGDSPQHPVVNPDHGQREDREIALEPAIRGMPRRRVVEVPPLRADVQLLDDEGRPGTRAGRASEDHFLLGPRGARASLQGTGEFRVGRDHPTSCLRARALPTPSIQRVIVTPPFLLIPQHVECGFHLHELLGGRAGLGGVEMTAVGVQLERASSPKWGERTHRDFDANATRISSSEADGGTPRIS